MALRFIETFRLDYGICKDFTPHLLRMRTTLAAHGLDSAHLNWMREGVTQCPNFAPVIKGRLIYGERIEEISFLRYQPRDIRTLRVVDGGGIQYEFKYENRECISSLFAQRGDADDILIARNGHLTDTSFSNIALLNGTTWITPTSYLLNGTKRQNLLREGLLQEREVCLGDLTKYQELHLLNAMLDFPNAHGIKILGIRGL